MSYTQILHTRLRKLLAEPDTQLVEVLPPAEYEALHIPGAISIPLKILDERTTAGLDKTKAVVVYCFDGIRDMSPRAACRLATLGFEQVYDYIPSKVDWMARGLPMEGATADAPRAIDLARVDVVTCRFDETIAEVRPRVAASPHGFAFVTTADGILFGRLRKAILEDDPNRRAGDVMEPGPSTNRPDLDPAELLAKLQNADLKTAVLSDPEGRLLGVVLRADLERR